VGVRRVRADEWEELRALRVRALEESPDSFGSTAFEARRRDEAEWRAWATAGASSSTSAIFVAEEGGRLAGLCGVFLHEGEPWIGQIVAMWVDPRHRGRRLAEELLDAASEWSADRGADELVLDVTETNEAARRLYGRAGFAETGTTVPLRSNPALLTVEMRKQLRVTDPVVVRRSA
jgi:ribosomal protein S18 acetylase RimI-like enzyme